MLVSECCEATEVATWADGRRSRLTLSDVLSYLYVIQVCHFLGQVFAVSCKTSWVLCEVFFLGPIYL